MQKLVHFDCPSCQAKRLHQGQSPAPLWEFKSMAIQALTFSWLFVHCPKAARWFICAR